MLRQHQCREDVSETLSQRLVQKNGADHRHFFASYCTQQNLSYKYVLEWMGRSSSAILDMYFTMNDRQAQAAINGLSFNSDKTENRTIVGQSLQHSEASLPQRAQV